MNGTDLTGPASPIQLGGGPAVNVSALGPVLGLSVRASGGKVVIVDRSGATWEGAANGTALRGPGRTLALDYPLQVQGASVYLPVAAVGELSHLNAAVNREKQTVTLLSPGSPAPSDGAEPAPPNSKSSSETGTNAASGAPSPSQAPETVSVVVGAPGKSREGAASLEPVLLSVIDQTGKQVQSEASEGWQPLTMEKTAAEKAEQAQLQGDTGLLFGRGRSSDVHPPAAHDRVRLGVGVGYVQGTDYGLDLSAAGGVKGVRVSANSLLTHGPKGLRVYSGQLQLRDFDQGWGLSLGDLGSDIWGARRGVRFTRWDRQGQATWVGLYLGDRRFGALAPTGAVGTERRLSRNWLAGAEVAANGSYALRSQMQVSKRMDLYGFARHSVSSEGTDGTGVLATYLLGKAISLYGSFDTSGSKAEKNTLTTYGIRLPVWKQVDLTLENTLSSASSGQYSRKSAMVGLPLGGFRLYSRYEWGSRNFHLDGPLFAPTVRNRNWSATLLFPSTNRFHLDYQVQRSWENGGASSRWEQMVGTYQLSARTQLQAIGGFPDLTDPQQFRFRVDQQLQDDLSLKLDYGQLTPYQGGSGGRQHGFSVLLDKKWNLNTPARGGSLQGRVVDQAGTPVPNVIVRCGSYSATTNAKGEYRLAPLPFGGYAVELDEESLPANYRSTEAAQAVKIAPHDGRTLNFVVIPLSTVSGHVFMDQNGNHRYDPGEGVKGIVMEMDGFATVTDRTGAYGFYNVDPGAHAVRVLADRLPGMELDPVGPTEGQVELKPDQPVTGVDFEVKPHEKEIVFQLLLSDAEEEKKDAG